jgi:hypothetical protein
MLLRWRSVRNWQRCQRRRERWPHRRCSEEGVRWSGQDRWPRRAQPHVDGANLGVVEGPPGGAAPALAGSQCSGAVVSAVTSPTTAVGTTMTVAAATTATPAAIAIATTTVATAASVGGSQRSRTTEGGRGGWGSTLLSRGG